MENYPLFTPPEKVWDNIKARTFEKKEHGLLSRFLYYQKVTIGVLSVVLLLFVASIMFRPNNNTNYVAYNINRTDKLLHRTDKFIGIELLVETSGINEIEQLAYSSETEKLPDAIYILLDEIEQLGDETSDDLNGDLLLVNNA